MDVPAEDTERTGFPAAVDGEENWLPGWLEGVRGDALAPESGPDVISHLGGITVCLGGSGSRRVSLRESGSGTKWLSDSVVRKEKKKKNTNMMECDSSFTLINQLAEKRTLLRRENQIQERIIFAVKNL